MTLAEAEAWLDGLINREKQRRFSYGRFGLGAIESLLALIGHPERGLSVVHIAGSKGKGSTALLTEALLLALGETVGTFTSPHLVRWTERFRVDGTEVVGEKLAQVVELIRPHVDALRQQQPEAAPSFFDATTAAGLMLFERARVDRVILEVGLGGRLDSTNAVSPAVTCVTSIEYEHTDKLGETLSEIAGEKAGILKSNVPCVMGRLPEEAAAVVRARAADLDAPLLHLGVDFEVEPGTDPRRLRFSATDGFSLEAPLAAVGAHQRDNAALAVAAVRALGAFPDSALADAAARAFGNVSLPGRLEVVERDAESGAPTVIVDSAHTQRSAASLRAFLDELHAKRTHLVLSVGSDKALDAILDALIPGVGEPGIERVTLTRAEPVRAIAPEEIAARLHVRRPDLRIEVVEDPAEAIAGARRQLRSGALLCVTGSFYLAGIAREILVRSKEQ